MSDNVKLWDFFCTIKHFKISVTHDFLLEVNPKPSFLRVQNIQTGTKKMSSKMIFWSDLIMK